MKGVKEPIRCVLRIGLSVICVIRGDTFVEGDDDEEDDDDDDGDQHDEEFGRVEPSGLAFRDHFVNTHFR